MPAIENFKQIESFKKHCLRYTQFSFFSFKSRERKFGSGKKQQMGHFKHC